MRRNLLAGLVIVALMGFAILAGREPEERSVDEVREADIRSVSFEDIIWYELRVRRSGMYYFIPISNNGFRELHNLLTTTLQPLRQPRFFPGLGYMLQFGTRNGTIYQVSMILPESGSEGWSDPISVWVSETAYNSPELAVYLSNNEDSLVPKWNISYDQPFSQR